MKQGSSSYNRPQMKREPIPHAQSVAGVSQIGTALGNKATDVPGTLPGGAKALNKGRGFSAPHDEGRTIHHGGSQRKHD
jgi:hypothetical protein